MIRFIMQEKIRYMTRARGFTLIELLIVMTVIAILMAIALPSFKGMQVEAWRTKAQGDLRVLKLAVESYYKNRSNHYPPLLNYMQTIKGAVPGIMETDLYDPFGATSTTPYVYFLSTGDPATARYYMLYSVGTRGNGTASVSDSGSITVSNDAIWESNGYQ